MIGKAKAHSRGRLCHTIIALTGKADHRVIGESKAHREECLCHTSLCDIAEIGKARCGKLGANDRETSLLS